MTQHAPARPTITAAVITLNEARHIREWLAALAWADERLMIDGGSTDDTATIAREAGARTVVEPFQNFARQRNLALSLARGDWVFFVDADERPTPALVSEIRRRLADCRQVAFHVPIRSTIFGRAFRFSGTQDDRPLRLLRRDAGTWSGEVHEVFRPAGPVSTLKHHLLHTTMPDVWTFLRKMNRYTDLEARARVRAGRRWRWRDQWLAPPREVFRRLLWKHGWLDGPRGWAFCLLSGLSEWVLAAKHRELQTTLPRDAALRRWTEETETITNHRFTTNDISTASPVQPPHIPVADHSSRLEAGERS